MSPAVATLRLAQCLWVVGIAVPSGARAQGDDKAHRAEALLAELVGTYGVSGDEGRVRAVIENHLPSGARSEVDSAGNLWVMVGRGDPLVVFVAHLDEIGYQVKKIRDDGTLELRRRGGFLPWLWEASAALVHTPSGPVPGVFMPRDSVGSPPTRMPRSLFRVDVGTGSRSETQRLGVLVGQMVTQPKRLVRLGATRATARSLDDRMGSAAQLLALQSLNQGDLKHEIIFLWVVREEIGLEGSAAAARALGSRPSRVYPVDTFVSADSPLDPQNFAVQPLGEGPVARAVDNSSVTPPAVVDSLRRLAERHRIPLQIGTTNGGNDGSAFQAWGVVDVPIGWPLRFSHSPVEVVDLRDLVWLADLVQAIAEDW